MARDTAPGFRHRLASWLPFRASQKPSNQAYSSLDNPHLLSAGPMATDAISENAGINGYLSSEARLTAADGDDEDACTVPLTGHSTVSPEPPVELERTMGIVSGTALVCGLMIGSGIFSTPGVILGLTGTAAMSLTYWILAAVITLCGALSYLELGCLLPESGGEQVYLDYCIRKPRQLFGFLFAFFTIICMRPGSIATNTIIFGKYLVYSVYGPSHNIHSESTLAAMEWQHRALAMACLVLITALNMVSTKWSLRALDALTWLKLGVLALISLTGIGILLGWASNVPRSDLWSRGFSGTTRSLHRHSSAIFDAFWAYDGWHNLNFCLGELKNPHRNLPICATGGVLVTTVLYLFTNVAFFSVVSMEDVLLEQEVLAGTWGTMVFGEAFGRIVIPIAIAVSCAGSVSAMIFGISRLIVAAGQKNYLPYGTFWAKLHRKTGTPINALILNFFLVTLYTLGPPPGEAFQFLVTFVSYPTRLFYGLTVVGLLLLRRREPHLTRIFKVWLPLPYVFIITTLFLCVFSFMPPLDGKIINDNGIPYFLSPMLGALYILVGVPFWYYLVHRRNVAGTTLPCLTSQVQ
ncbi:hypothetical protein H4R35_007144 [Dimargaris xerosporica]|nr:hypothetical protein H4R35_007144 [Dimargaris xerosporica]